ncbi:MAG: hypothetical protein HFI84_06685 [Eubacterium sp.]|nr:hypothetical protein [Eubacterium sp.]
MRSKKMIACLLAGAACIGLAFGGCGNKIQDDAVFATLDDTTITMGVANFYAKYQQAIYDSYYMSYFGEDMWNQDMYGNGSTMTEDVKQEAAEALQEMYLLKAHMEEYDVSISEEEESAIQKAADDFIAANSGEAVKQIGASNKENVTEVLRLQTIKQKMHDRIIEDADTKVTDKEAAQRTFSYLEIKTDSYTDAESNTVTYTEEEKADLKKKAEEIAAAENFDTAVTDAGYSLSTASYGSAKDEGASFDTAVLEAADALKEGEISGVVETENAYYVLRLDKELDEEATASKKESLISEKEEAHYEDILSGWKEKAKWEINEDEWAKVTFEDHFKQPEAEETETPEEDPAVTEEAPAAVSGQGAEDTEAE